MVLENIKEQSFLSELARNINLKVAKFLNENASFGETSNGATFISRNPKIIYVIVC